MVAFAYLPPTSAHHLHYQHSHYQRSAGTLRTSTSSGTASIAFTSTTSNTSPYSPTTTFSTSAPSSPDALLSATIASKHAEITPPPLAAAAATTTRRSSTTLGRDLAADASAGARKAAQKAWGKREERYGYNARPSPRERRKRSGVKGLWIEFVLWVKIGLVRMQRKVKRWVSL